MANNFFRFKEFTIRQGQCAQKVSTDSVLLGAWANLDKVENVLDIGSGTGIVSLMVAQRSNAYIDAVEIEKKAYSQSLDNFRQSKWLNRIKAFNVDFCDFYKNTEKKYDLIISNPPFFVKSLKTENVEVNLARHNDKLPFRELVKGADALLEENGRLCIILPYAEGCVFIADAVKKGLFCVRKTNVKTKHHAPVKRLLLEFARKPVPCEGDYLVINDEENDYSQKYRELTKDFYLFV